MSHSESNNIPPEDFVRPKRGPLQLQVSVVLITLGCVWIVISLHSLYDGIRLPQSTPKTFAPLNQLRSTALNPTLTPDQFQTQKIENCSVDMVLATILIVSGILMLNRRCSLKTLLLASLFIGAMGALPRLFGMS